MSYFLFLAEGKKTQRGWQSTSYRELESKLKSSESGLVIQPAQIVLDGNDLCGCTIHDGVSSERLFVTKKSSQPVPPGQRILLSLQLDHSVETFFSMRWINGDVSGFSAETKDAKEFDIQNALISEIELRTETVFFLRKERQFGARWIRAYR